MKLHQVLAVLKGASSDAHSVLTRTHHDLMKGQLLGGLRKVYRAADEDDTVTFPAEHQKVQIKANEAIADMLPSQVRLFDVTAMRDFSNMKAAANIVVDGKIIVEKAPVPYLLWLEKKLAELEVFIKKIPVLSPEFNWTPDAAEGWVSHEVVTTKTKKVKRVQIMHPGTDKHPPQVQPYDEDVVQGFWTTVRYSGALPQADVNTLLKRVRLLQDAVKVAIAEANMADVDDPKPGKKIFDFVFADVVE